MKKIFLSYSQSDREWERRVRELVEETVHDEGLQVVYSDLQYERVTVPSHYLEMLAGVDCFVAVISYDRLNVFHELGLGIAEQLAKKIILVTTKDFGSEFRLNNFTQIMYTQSNKGLMELQKEIRNTFRSLMYRDESHREIDGKSDVLSHALRRLQAAYRITTNLDYEKSLTSIFHEKDFLQNLGRNIFRYTNFDQAEKMDEKLRPIYERLDRIEKKLDHQNSLIENLAQKEMNTSDQTSFSMKFDNDIPYTTVKKFLGEFMTEVHQREGSLNTAGATTGKIK